MTTVDRAAESAARRQTWQTNYLHPPAQRPASSARGVHHMALICADVVESIGSVQHIAISVEPTQLEQIKARPKQHDVASKGPDRGLTTSAYCIDPDGIQIELIAEPLLTMDGRGLGE